MKIFRKLMAVSAVAVVVLGMSACGNNQKKSEIEKKDMEAMAQVEIAGNYDESKPSVIPGDAYVALKVMPEQLFDKAIGEHDSKLAREWNKMKSSLAMMAPAFGDPSKLGVSLKKPMFVTLSSDFENIAKDDVSAEVCLIASLEDRDAFISAVDNVIEMLGEESGISKDYSENKYTHYVLSADKGKSLDLGVMSKVAVVRFMYDVENEAADLKKSMSRLFTKGDHKKSEGFKDFYASTSDISLWFDLDKSMDVMMPVFQMMEASQFKVLEQYKPLYENASMVADLDFKEGKTVLKAKVFGSEQMKENTMKYYTAASDKYFKYLPASSVFVANIAIKDFSGLLNEMTQMNPELVESLEYLEESFGIDEELMEGFPGQITLAVDGHMIGKSEVPGIIAYMECDENVWDFIESNLEEVAEPVGYNQYSIDDRLYVGYDGTAVILVEAETLRRSYQGGISSFGSTALADEISEYGLAFNVAAIPMDVLDDFIREHREIFKNGRDLLAFISSVTVSSSFEDMTTTLTLNMGDKYHNLLNKLLVRMAEQINL